MTKTSSYYTSSMNSLSNVVLNARSVRRVLNDIKEVVNEYHSGILYINDWAASLNIRVKSETSIRAIANAMRQALQVRSMTRDIDSYTGSVMYKITTQSVHRSGKLKFGSVTVGISGSGEADGCEIVPVTTEKWVEAVPAHAEKSTEYRVVDPEKCLGADSSEPKPTPSAPSADTAS